MIKITNELLESTEAAIVRHNGEFPLEMFLRLSEEMREENISLYNSLLFTANRIADDIVDDFSLPQDTKKVIIVNTMWLPLITYNTIKQQMLSNELSGE